jgi:hypothetical protein
MVPDLTWSSGFFPFASITVLTPGILATGRHVRFGKQTTHSPTKIQDEIALDKMIISISFDILFMLDFLNIYTYTNIILLFFFA